MSVEPSAAVLLWRGDPERAKRAHLAVAGLVVDLSVEQGAA
ncbi:MAG: hypothetical protein ACK47M_21370 [Caldilinea sp.]